MIRWSKTGDGIISTDGRYFITARGFLYGATLNWVLYDLRNNSYQDGFRYQRDAKALAEELA